MHAVSILIAERKWSQALESIRGIPDHSRIEVNRLALQIVLESVNHWISEAARLMVKQAAPAGPDDVVEAILMCASRLEEGVRQQASTQLTLQTLCSEVATIPDEIRRLRR